MLSFQIFIDYEKRVCKVRKNKDLHDINQNLKNFLNPTRRGLFLEYWTWGGAIMAPPQNFLKFWPFFHKNGKESRTTLFSPILVKKAPCPYFLVKSFLRPQQRCDPDPNSY